MSRSPSSFTGTPPRVVDAARSAPAAQNAVEPIDSARLLAGADEIRINHHGTLYRLRQTALGKLILTK